MSRPSPSPFASLSSLRHRVACGLAVVGVAAALHGCCSSHEEEVCILVDYGESCPDKGDAEGRWGLDIVNGPREAMFMDGRSDRDESLHGTVCCYKAKFESCSQLKTY